MSMHSTYNPLPAEIMSKKEIFERVYAKIANSMAEFNLSGKKFEENLKKTSKLFTKEISKAVKKKKKSEIK